MNQKEIIEALESIKHALSLEPTSNVPAMIRVSALLTSLKSSGGEQREVDEEVQKLRSILIPAYYHGKDSSNAILQGMYERIIKECGNPSRWIGEDFKNFTAAGLQINTKEGV